ncbi:MAG: glycyl-radical enzyme activating protein [Spirochaetes bacterium]|nr:glycyl-radical enzyme activating protein [Spirochaetota bacterium]
MAKEIKAKIYDIQGFSVHDGPGIRTTVFLKGCPLRCAWCHSPESQEFHTELNWMSIRCLGLDACGSCLSVCPNDAVTRGPVTKSASGEDIAYPRIDKSKCNDCGACAEVCKADALYMCGTDYTVDEVMYRILRDKPFFEESGGGVTVSGGECLYQADFTLELLKRCRENGIHTAVDTTGYVKWEIIEKVIPYTDVFLYDLKCMDSDLHKQVTGVPNELILENAVKIAEAGGRFWMRIPVIPLLNDSEEHFQKYCDFLVKIKDSLDIVQLLPYHKMGVSKHDRLLKNEKIFVAEPPKEELMQARKKQLEACGLNVRIH